MRACACARARCVRVRVRVVSVWCGSYRSETEREEVLLFGAGLLEAMLLSLSISLSIFPPPLSPFLTPSLPRALSQSLSLSVALSLSLMPHPLSLDHRFVSFIHCLSLPFLNSCVLVPSTSIQSSLPLSLSLSPSLSPVSSPFLSLNGIKRALSLSFSLTRTAVSYVLCLDLSSLALDCYHKFFSLSLSLSLSSLSLFLSLSVSLSLALLSL